MSDLNDKTEKLLRDLADKLGVTVEHLWSVLIRGNKVEGYILLTFVLIGLALIVAGGLSLRHAMVNEPDTEEAFAIGGFIGCLIGLVLFGTCFYWCVMDLTIPEYGALADILSHLH